jgi:hypothetical protein
MRGGAGWHCCGGFCIAYSACPSLFHHYSLWHCASRVVSIGMVMAADMSVRLVSEGGACSCGLWFCVHMKRGEGSSAGLCWFNACIHLLLECTIAAAAAVSLTNLKS